MNRIYLILLVLSFLLSMGCSDTPAGAQSTEGVATGDNRLATWNENALFGRIIALEGDMLTVQLGTLARPEGAFPPDGQKPSNPEENKLSNPPDGRDDQPPARPSEKPENAQDEDPAKETDSNKAEMQPKGGRGGGHRMGDFIPAEESINLTLSHLSIYRQSMEGTVPIDAGEIAIDDLLMIALDEKESPISITLLSDPARNNSPTAAPETALEGTPTPG